MRRSLVPILSLVLSLVCPRAFGSQITLGAQGYSWMTNYKDNTGGYELLVPFTLNLNFSNDFSVYGFAQYAMGNYRSSASDPNVFDLADFSDSVLGTEVRFSNFSVPALLNMSVNLPSGNPAWENQQSTASVPTEFIDSRYHGRGFGVNAMYGISFPSGSTELGAAVGYSYSGAYNPGTYSNLTAGDLKLGDSFFLSLDHVTSFSGNQRQYIRFSGYAFLPTQVGTTNIYQQGINLNASYSWVNPNGFSFELGAQYYFPSETPAPENADVLKAEPNTYWAPRFYCTPSYRFGDLKLNGIVKYVLPNNYPVSDPIYYEGGGFMLGLEPSLKLPFDEGSDILLNAAYDFIDHHNVLDVDLVTRDEIYYNLVTFGMTYEIRL